MRWVAKIYRDNEIAKLPVEGAEISAEVYQMAEEILNHEPGSLSFEKTTDAPSPTATTRYKKIKGITYIIIVEQTG